MAENLRLSHLILYDKWPGTPNPNLGIPTGGFDATAWNLSTADDTATADTPPYPLGTKIQAYTDNSECPGYYTMMYLARHEFSSECISSDFSEANIFCSTPGVLCQTHVSATPTDTSGPAPYYYVTACYTVQSCEISNGNPVAVACTTADADSSIALTTDPKANGYGHALGWFWVGGVCPCADITLLKGLGDSLAGADITTDAGAYQKKGPVMLCYTAASVKLFSTDMSNFNDSSAFLNTISPTGAAIGWACGSSAG